MTQALALRRLMRAAGHEVAGVVLGNSPQRDVPDFFLDKIEAPVRYVRSPNFVADAQKRAVHTVRTFLRGLWSLRHVRDGLDTIDAALRQHRPDVVVNFFEPMGGLYYACARPATPMVCVGHQYMFHHPTYRFPGGWPVRRWAMKVFTRITAWGATRRLALSLYPAPDRPEDDMAVLPPLLRRDLFGLPLGEEEPFLLLYLLNSGYAESVIQWHEQHPDVRLHCFWDRTGAAPVEHYDDTLTFHRLDDEKFLSMMARCRGLVCTAGFESIGEAMYLGKPVQVIPVEGHFEQYCNALDTVRVGAGIRSETFDIGRLLRFLPRHEHTTQRFRRWVTEARTRFLHEIEDVAGVAAPEQTSEASLAVSDYQLAG
jgi:uncharacterized protein (TIGR00661 family)